MNRPSILIRLSPFWMGAYEVTFDEYDLFFNDVSLSQNIVTDAVTRPSSPYIDMTLGMGKEGGFPANSMQQYGALMYCKWLYKKTGIFYRLAHRSRMGICLSCRQQHCLSFWR